MIASVGSAMAEQATATEQIAKATQDIRRQSDQTAKGLAEQTKAVSDISDATRNVAKQIAMITRANRQQATDATSVLNTITELKRVGGVALRGAEDTGAIAASLVERSRALGQLTLEH